MTQPRHHQAGPGPLPLRQDGETVLIAADDLRDRIEAHLRYARRELGNPVNKAEIDQEWIRGRISAFTADLSLLPARRRAPVEASAEAQEAPARESAQEDPPTARP